MAPSHVIRPENILRRAEDLIAVDQKDAALQTLYDFITSKRTRSLLPADLEPIAVLFVTLGVELRNGKLVKDGLHQHKKNVQANENGLASVGNVVKKFLEVSEAKLNEAHSKANDISAASSEKPSYDAEFQDEGEDEDGESSTIGISPEDILMSTVSTDDTKDRSDRELVAPWLRFLWEAYRTVLDILRNNSKLEVAYAHVVSSAFNFCVKYSRKTEFRRLCEMLRTHLQSVSQKPTGKYQIENPIDLSDPETLQRYLETRFNQLNVSVKLELWQESFRSVEDVHTLMSVSKRQPKPSMMINYYENLAKIFNVADNSLFHAAARQRFFALFVQSPIATEEELKHYASLQLLSVLAVPQTSTVANIDDFSKRKNSRLASLLNLTRIPTRESLLEQTLSRDLLSIVDPSLAKLYNLLESDFHPLSFSVNAKDIFAQIESNKDFAPYIQPLLTVVLNKLFGQISEVYDTIKMDFLVKLATFEGSFRLSPLEIESYLLSASSSNLLSVKIDHESKVVVFKSDPFDDSLPFTTSSSASKSLQLSPAELIRYQLSNLAKTLSASAKLLNPSIKESEAQIREKALKAANEGFAQEREAILRRAKILETRQKETAEKKRLDEEAANAARLEKLAAVRKAEQERIEQEAAKRAEEKREKAIEAVRTAEKKKLVEQINANGIINIDINEVEDLDTNKLRLMQVEKLEQDRKVLEDRNEATSKKFDYIERAQRLYELPMLKKEAEGQMGKEQEEYEAIKSKIVAKAKKEHEEAIKIRDRLKRVVPDFEAFVSDLKAKTFTSYEEEKKAASDALEAAKKERIAQYIADKKAKAEAEKLARAEAAKWEVNPKKLTFAQKQALRREGKWPGPSGSGSPVPAPTSSSNGDLVRGSAAPPPAPANPERALYDKLKIKEADGTLTFSDKVKLKKLAAQFD